MKVSDILTGLLFIVAGFYIFLEAQNFPAVRGQLYGSTFFPSLIGISMALGGLTLCITSVVKKRVRPLLTRAEWLKSARGLGSVFLIFVTLVFYMMFSDRLGFCMTSFIIILVVQKWMGARLLPACIISITATAIFYTVFSLLLRVPLPHGFVEQFL